nr:hypothetical protein [Tanacetum cinerariifolium]
MMVNESYLSVREKHTFVSKMNSGTLVDNGVMDMDATMDNLEDMISNLEKVFAYLKNKKMLERIENNPNKEIIINQSGKSSDETPSSDDTTDKNIAKFKVAAKSKSSTSRPEKVTSHKVVTPKVQTKLFPAKSPVPIRNCILGLAAVHTWSYIASPTFYYIYNPCTNMFKRLSQPENSHDDSHFHVTVVLRMAFDARKPLDYKVVQVAVHPNYNLEIQVYSLETESDNRQLTLYKLNTKEDHDHPIITTIKIPHWLHRGRNFLQSFSGNIGSDNLMLKRGGKDVQGVCDLGGKGERYKGVQYFESGQGNMFWVLATLAPEFIFGLARLGLTKGSVLLAFLTRNT